MFMVLNGFFVANRYGMDRGIRASSSANLVSVYELMPKRQPPSQFDGLDNLPFSVDNDSKLATFIITRTASVVSKYPFA